MRKGGSQVATLLTYLPTFDHNDDLLVPLWPDSYISTYLPTYLPTFDQNDDLLVLLWPGSYMSSQAGIAEGVDGLIQHRGHRSHVEDDAGVGAVGR